MYPQTLFLLCSILLLNSARNVVSSRILGVSPTPSYSHQVVFRPLWKELSLRGHELVVLTTDPIKDSTLTNLTEIDLSFAYDVYTRNITQIIEESKNDPGNFFRKFNALMMEVFDEELSHPEVLKMINNKDEHFDLVIVEYIFPVMFGFKERFKCPYIGITSFDSSLLGHKAVGNPTHPVLYPEAVLPYEGNLSFLERVAAVVYYIWRHTVTVIDEHDELMRKHFGEDLPYIMEIVRDVSLLLVNTNPVTHVARPITPATVLIGGGMHIEPPKPLPEELQRYLDNATNGVVYFSLGSNVKSQYIKPEVRKAILEGLGSLPHAVLWKFEADDLPDKPENVKIAKWLPQQDILRHPNIKLFITQGGLQSMEEAIYSNVPMLGIPFFADQFSNVRRLVYKGIGLSLDYKTMTKEDIREAALEVINNPKYRLKIKELAEISLDQPMTGLERAVWWTEYVLRHKGAEHFKSKSVTMPHYQYLLLDVLGFLMAVLSVVIYVLFIIAKRLFKMSQVLTKLSTDKKTD